VTRHNLVLIFVALGTAISFAIVQRMFDRADHDKAAKLVRMFPSRDGKTTVEDLLARRDPAARGEGAWSTEILSGCRGFVRVRCTLPAAAGGEYAFDVDLVRRAIHPGNDQGRRLLEELGGRDVPRQLPQ
jgi:hypothetical protein